MLDLSDRNMATSGAGSLSESDKLSEAAVLPPKIGYRYRHFKGGLYRVEGLCTVEATQEIGVLYRALDPCARPDVWMRPISSFFSLAGGTSRFVEVHEPSADALVRYLPESLVPAASLDYILSHYDSPGRFFHARWHVYDLFEKAANNGLDLAPEQAIALLFQDIVYSAGVPEGMNEKLSSLYVKNMASALGKFRVDVACRIIEDTARNKPTIPESELVLDLTTASLADDTTEFCANDELIWLETRHLLDAGDPRRDFDTRRLKYLLALAERGPLFCSQALNHLEKRARENLETFRLAWVSKYSKEKVA